MNAERLDLDSLWESQYNDETVLYNDALTCLHEAEILGTAENKADLVEAMHLVGVAMDLLGSIKGLKTDALKLRALTLEENLSIK